MLEIGINENLKFGADSEITEKGGFNLHLASGEAAASALDMLETLEDAEDSKLLIFPPDIKEYGKETIRSAMDIMKDLKQFHKIFHHMFCLYAPTEDVLKDFPLNSMLKGIKVTKENQDTILTQESVVQKMFENIGKAAIEYIKKKDLANAEPFRLKLLRQSKKKAFPRFTYRPDFGVWVELMAIPKEKSKVTFDKFEISKGYDNAEPVLDDVSDDAGADAFEEDAIPEASQEDVSFQ